MALAQINLSWDKVSYDARAKDHKVNLDVLAFDGNCSLSSGAHMNRDANSPTATSEHFGNKFEVDQCILLSLSQVD